MRWLRGAQVFTFVLAVSFLCSPGNAAAGPSGGALLFDGTDDLARIPQVAGIPTGNQPYTQEMWVCILDYELSYWNGVDSYNGFLLSRGSEGGHTGAHMCLMYRNYGLTHWGDDWNTGVRAMPYVWHHLATTWDGSRECLYVNGQLRAQRTASAFGISSGTVTLGRHGNVDGYWFRGLMDEVSIWSGARSVSQIGDDMQQGFPSGSPGLVACWKFDEGAGQVLVDSAHGNNGFLGSSVAVENADPRRVSASVPTIVSLRNRALLDKIMDSAWLPFAFTVWGKAQSLGGNAVMLDDGSGKPIKVQSNGAMPAFSDGDHLMATGRLSISGSGRALVADQAWVRKLLP